MSVEAITWALRQPIKQSSAKFVLVVLANCASGDTFLAYPSTAYICEATGQDRKTVMACLAKLREWGLIDDTGKRSGATKQVVVYRLPCGPDLLTKEVQKRDSSENGTVPKTEANRSVFPHKQAQKRDTEPSGTVSNQQPRADARSARGTRLPDDWQPTPELLGFAVARVPGAVEEEIEKFKDHWRAMAGGRAAKLDWGATFRNWIRNSKNFTGASHATHRKPSLCERAQQAAIDGELRDHAKRQFDASVVGADDGDVRPQVVERLR